MTKFAGPHQGIFSNAPPGPPGRLGPGADQSQADAEGLPGSAMDAGADGSFPQPPPAGAHAPPVSNLAMAEAAKLPMTSAGFFNELKRQCQIKFMHHQMRTLFLSTLLMDWSGLPDTICWI